MSDYSRVYPFILDMKKLDVTQNTKAFFSTNDMNTGVLLLQLTMDGTPINLTGCTVYSTIEKSDGLLVINNCTILDAANGGVELKLTTQSLATSGECKFEIAINSSDKKKKATSPKMIFNVEKALENDSAIQSSNEFGVITDLILTIDDKIANLKDGKSAYEVAKENGFTGTQKEWLTSLKGELDVNKTYSSLVTNNKTIIGAINEVNSKPSGGSDSSNEKVIPQQTNTPSECEIFMVASAGATFRLTNPKSVTITGNNFTIDALDGEVYVEFTSNGSLEIECTKKGTGYYMLSSNTGTPDTGWKSELKAYIFTGTTGQRIKVLGNNAGWGFSVRTKQLSELCFNSQTGVEKIAFIKTNTIIYQNEINSEVEQLKCEIQELKLALYKASVLPKPN